PGEGASFASGNSSRDRFASPSRAPSWGNDSPTHSSACCRPSSASLAVFNGCLASSGCCSIKTWVRFETPRTCSQRQCDKGLAQRWQRCRGSLRLGGMAPFYETPVLHRCDWRRQVRRITVLFYRCSQPLQEFARRIQLVQIWQIPRAQTHLPKTEAATVVFDVFLLAQALECQFTNCQVGVHPSLQPLRLGLPGLARCRAAWTRMLAVIHLGLGRRVHGHSGHGGPQQELVILL